MNKENTYNRIAACALQLFNEQGERNTSTNHIARHLGISPGNLYYHFANKDKIIVLLFERYRSTLIGFFTQTPLPDSVKAMADYMAGIYDILWDYRFLFSDVNSLLMRSADLAGEHNRFTREQFMPLALKYFRVLQQQDILEIDDINARNLAINLWLITKYWFDFNSSINGATPEHREKQIKARGIYRSLSLIRPHVRAKYLAEFDRLIQPLENGSNAE